jgi:hypothetical protein
MSMIAQTTIEDEPRPAYPGMIADMGPIRVKSGVAATRKTVSIAVVPANSTAFSVTINGTVFSITSDIDATDGEVTSALRDSINAGSEPVTATGAVSPLIIKSSIDGEDGDFTYAVSAGLTATLVAPQGGGLPFGRFVCMDELSTYDRGVRLPSTAADVTGGRALGIVCADNYTRAADGTPDAVPSYSMANVLEVGKIWVETEVPVKKGDSAYVRYGATGLGPGSLTNVATGAAEMTHAVFDGDSRVVDGKNLAILYVNR